MPSLKKTKTLDTIFSQYIRLRDSDSNGYGRCCTSGKPVYWKYADAGHYIDRKHHPTRWCEKNVHLQSKEENQGKDGNLKQYKNFLIKKYGDGVIQELVIKSKSLKKMYDFELDEMIKHYQKEVKRLKSEKSLYD